MLADLPAIHLESDLHHTTQHQIAIKGARRPAPNRTVIAFTASSQRVKWTGGGH